MDPGPEEAFIAESNACALCSWVTNDEDRPDAVLS